jgi:glycosyltransferase involved in cell wall biosynthesis
MPLVSIVVPVYKVEKYLERCVKSLLCQTLHDIEIILVDDGSPDRCPQICDEYASRDERIKVVHKRNGGLSSARNAGLLVATGSYIGFVDSDDDVSLDMYERMLTIIEKYNTDFVMSDYLRIADDKSTSLKTTDIHQGLYTKQQIRKDIFPQCD